MSSLRAPSGQFHLYPFSTVMAQAASISASHTNDSQTTTLCSLANHAVMQQTNQEANQVALDVFCGSHLPAGSKELWLHRLLLFLRHIPILGGKLDKSEYCSTKKWSARASTRNCLLYWPANSPVRGAIILTLKPCRHTLQMKCMSTLSPLACHA